MAIFYKNTPFHPKTYLAKYFYYTNTTFISATKESEGTKAKKQNKSLSDKPQIEIEIINFLFFALSLYKFSKRAVSALAYRKPTNHKGKVNDLPKKTHTKDTKNDFQTITHTLSSFGILSCLHK